MARPLAQGGGTTAKCRIDARTYLVMETAEYLGSVTFTTNPTLVREVLKPMAKEFSDPMVWLYICPECAMKRVEEFQARHTSTVRDLTDDELRYGTE